MDINSVVKLLEKLTKEKFFGKLEIKFRDGQPYFCIRQEFLQVTPNGVVSVEPMSQRPTKPFQTFNPQTV